MLTDLGPRQFCTDTLSTFLAEAAAIINATPLTSISTLSDNQQPLTPAMLLTHKSQPHPPIPDKFEAPDVCSRRRWRQTQFLADQFWKRWPTENKCEWNFARVQQLIPSHDGVSRKAHVTSLYKTSIRATCDLILMFRPSVNVGECNGQH